MREFFASMRALSAIPARSLAQRLRFRRAMEFLTLGAPLFVRGTPLAMPDQKGRSNMKVGSICNQKIICARQDETVLTAARRMREHHVGSLVVIDGDDDHCVPAGMLTDRDIVVGVLARDFEHFPKLLVGDLMTKKPIIAVDEDEVSDVVKTMRRHGIRRMPVVDAKGCLQGIVSFDDIIEHLAAQLSSMAETVSRQPRIERQSRP